MDNIDYEVLAKRVAEILISSQGITKTVKTMDANGRITIPKDIRKQMGCGETTDFDVYVLNGNIVLEKK